MHAIVNYSLMIAQNNDNCYNVQDKYKHMHVNDIIEQQKKLSQNWLVGLMNIEGDLNISNMIRTSCLFGAKKVVLFGRRKFDRRGCVGSQNYIPIEKVDCLNNDGLSLNTDIILQYLMNNNILPILVEHGGINIFSKTFFEQLVNNKNSNFTPMIIMGNESNGMPHEFINFCKNHIANTMHVSIPQIGVMRSYNVSTAFGIVASKFMENMGYMPID